MHVIGFIRKPKVVKINRRMQSYNLLKPIFAALIFITFFLFTHCASKTYKFKDGSSYSSYFGFIKFVEPPTLSPNDDFKVAEITAYGIRIMNGFGLGYFHERLETIPMDCRIVIKVMNREQFEMMSEILLPIAREDICITIDQSQF